MPTEYVEQVDRLRPSVKQLLGHNPPLKLPPNAEEKHAPLPDINKIMTLTGNYRIGKRERRFWEGINVSAISARKKQQREKLQYDLGRARVIAKYNELCSREVGVGAGIAEPVEAST